MLNRENRNEPTGFRVIETLPILGNRRKVKLLDFKMLYPTLQTLVSNCDCCDSLQRRTVGIKGFMDWGVSRNWVRESQ